MVKAIRDIYEINLKHLRHAEEMLGKARDAKGKPETARYWANQVDAYRHITNEIKRRYDG